MALIQTSRIFPAKRDNGKRILLLCGFGGSVWQAKRMISTLNRAGYSVTALDFPKKVLADGDASLLPELVDEVVKFAEKEAKANNQPILLVGISLGALISLNILRRSEYFTNGILITGGNIVKVAQNIYGKKVWPQTYEDLARQWQQVNMFTDPKQLTGKKIIFVLPAKDKLIDPDEVRFEIKTQQLAGNKLILVERNSFGHLGTIIEETVLYPGRILDYIGKVSD